MRGEPYFDHDDLIDDFTARNTMDEQFITVQCDICSAEESIGGEINERTLEDEGWYLGPTSTLCSDHSESEAE